MDREKLEYHISTGKETLKVELKANLWQDNVEFAKDVAAIANTDSPNENDKGYIILGVRDKSDRNNPKAPEPFKGFNDEIEIDTYAGKLQDILNHYCNPSINISYNEKECFGKTLGIITIQKPTFRPVHICNSRHKEDNWNVWIRTGGTSPRRKKATDLELANLYAERFNQRGNFPFYDKNDWKNLLINENSAQFLASALHNMDSEVRKNAVRMLNMLKHERRIQLLLGMIYDEDYLVVWETIRALGDTKDKRVISVLSDFINDSLIFVDYDKKIDLVYEAIFQLGEIGIVDTEYHLMDVIEITDDEEILSEIMIALGKVGSETSRNFLKSLLSKNIYSKLRQDIKEAIKSIESREME